MLSFIRLYLLYLVFGGLCPQLLSAQDGYDRFFENLIDQNSVPGLSVAIISEGELSLTKGYGVRAIDSQLPVNDQTVFSAASLSKPVFAYLVLQLEADGQLDLDRPLSEYLNYQDLAHDDRAELITARMILSHSSGLPNWRRRGQLNLLFEPGTDFKYSGEGFVYLMRAVEKIMERPLQELMNEWVFTPLKMERSSYVWEPTFEDNFATPHNFRAEAFSIPRYQEANTAYSLQTTASDFGRFLLAVLKEENWPPRTLESVVTATSVIDKSDDLFWGLGWGIQRTSAGLSIWQWGDNGNFKAFTMLHPAQQKAMVYFTNSSNGLRFVPEIVEYVFKQDCPAFRYMDYPTKEHPHEALLSAILATDFESALPAFGSPYGQHQDTNLINYGRMAWVGRELRDRKRWVDAEQVFRANLRVFPGNHASWRDMADHSLLAGQLDSAAFYYQAALDIDPDSPGLQDLLDRLESPPAEGNVVLRMPHYAFSRQVMVAGSFNDWNRFTMPCVREGGEWVCRMELSPGTYEYKFIIDGVWIVDPRNPNVKANGEYVNSVLTVRN